MKLTRKQLKTIILESILNEMPMIRPKNPMDFIKDPEHKRKLDTLKDDNEAYAYSLATSIQPDLEDILSPGEIEEMEADLPAGAQLEEPGYRGDDYLEDEKLYDRLALIPYLREDYINYIGLDEMKTLMKVIGEDIHIYGFLSPFTVQVPSFLYKGPVVEYPFSPAMMVMSKSYYDRNRREIERSVRSTMDKSQYSTKRQMRDHFLLLVGLEIYYKGAHNIPGNVIKHPNIPHKIHNVVEKVENKTLFNEIMSDIILALIKMSSKTFVNSRHLALDQLGIGKTELIYHYNDDGKNMATDFIIQHINDKFKEHVDSGKLIFFDSNDGSAVPPYETIRVYTRK